MLDKINALRLTASLGRNFVEKVCFAWINRATPEVPR